MNANNAILGKTVEWMPIEIGLASSHIAGGRGVVHSIAYEGGDDTWQDFIALVELLDGDLVKVPITVAQMSVRNEAPDSIRWWVVAMLPRRVALWLVDAVPLGSWAPYVWGQAMGVKGVEVIPADKKEPAP